MRLYILLFATVLTSVPAFGQGILFKELYGSRKEGEVEVKHRWATSTWGSRLGSMSKTDAVISSQALSCDSEEKCFYRIQAGHELQRFENNITALGDTLERPAFRGLLEIKGRRRFLSELGVDSPSDKPFNSFDETNISFNGVLAPLADLRTMKENYWLYFVNFSSTRTFLPGIPLPGFIYVIPTASGWTYSLGIPIITITYVDFPKWMYSLTVGPYFYNTQLAYGPPAFQFGVSSSWKQDTYFIADRTNKDDRFFVDEKDVSAFIRHPLSDKLSLEWKLGYHFDQGIQYGKSYDKKSYPREDLGTSVAATVGIKARL